MQSDGPRLSVIINYLDRPASLRLCLESLSAQGLSHEEWEVVVVDSNCVGSDAMTLLLSESGVPFQHHYVREEGEPPWPIARARNFGIEKARGGLVLCLSADMILSPNTIRHLLVKAATHRLISMNPWRCDFEITFWLLGLLTRRRMELADLWCCDEPGQEELAQFVREHVHYDKPKAEWGGFQAFPKGFGLYDERFRWWGGEDTDFAERALMRGVETMWLEEHAPVRMYHLCHNRDIRKIIKDVDKSVAVLRRLREERMQPKECNLV